MNLQRCVKELKFLFQFDSFVIMPDYKCPVAFYQVVWGLEALGKVFVERVAGFPGAIIFCYRR